MERPIVSNRVLHIWEEYSPSLFDQSHPLCLSNGINSVVVCRNFFRDGSKALKSTYWVRVKEPSENNRGGLANRVKRFIRKRIDHFYFIKLVSDQVKNFDPFTIHFHFGTTAALFSDSPILIGRNVVVSFYGADISQALTKSKTLGAYRLLFKRCNIFHVLCSEARERLVRLGCAANKIKITNLPVRFISLPPLSSIRRGAFIFVMAARFVPKKGHHLAFFAIRKLIDDGWDVRLKCLGYGPDNWLTSLAIKHDLTNHVEIINNQQTSDFMRDYSLILANSHAVIAPSLRSTDGDDEGGPALTVIAAQGASRPVIVSDFPGSERSVTDGVEGLVVRQGDGLTLFQAMRSFVAGEVDYRTMGIRGCKRVREEFSVANYVCHLTNWYEGDYS